MQSVWGLMLQDLENKDSQSVCDTQRLQQKLVELQHALETASFAADTRCKSASAQMQMQLESLTAEQHTVQKSLTSQIVSLQQHIDSTTQQLHLAHSKLEERKSAHAEEVQRLRAELQQRQKDAADAKEKAEYDGNILKGQEQDLQVLHHQVHCFRFECAEGKPF